MRQVAWVALALAAWGCDAAERALAAPDQGPQEVEFEQPLETPVASLDDDGVSEVCQAFGAAVLRKLPPETRCVPAGLVAASQAPGPAEPACGDARDACVRLARLGSGDLPDLPAGPCPFQTVDEATCTASLAELKPCLDALADGAVAQISQALTCTLAGEPQLPDVQIEVPEADGVMACAEFSMACPGFLERPGD